MAVCFKFGYGDDDRFPLQSGYDKDARNLNKNVIKR